MHPVLPRRPGCLQGRVPGKTGVWVGERKIGAVGVRISQGVTSHGVALNVCTDLSLFAHIVPCGTPDKEVTSIHRQLAGSRWGELGHPSQQRQQQQLEEQQPLTAPSLQQVAQCFLSAFADHFGYGQIEALPDVNRLAAQLGCEAGRPAAEQAATGGRRA